jgi:hypothetical protein
MIPARNKLYLFLCIACLAGYTWLLVSYNSGAGGSSAGVCLVKDVTGLPCPSCGTTRSVISLLGGDLRGALHWNPFGVLILALLVLVPPWLFYDLLMKKMSLLVFYRKSENFLRRRWVALPAILLVLANWAWNIYKGL